MRTLFATLFALLLLLVPPAAAQAVDLLFTGSDGTTSQELRLGIDPSATVGLDPLLGEAELPPFPPGGVFEVRFVGSNVPAELGQGSYRDYRPGAADFSGAIEHALQWQLGAGASVFTIGYDLPDGASVLVEDFFGGVVVSETLTGTGNFQVTNTSLNQVKLTVTYSGGGSANTAPAFTSTAVTSGQIGAAYSYAVTATDTDGDPLTLTAPTLPAWATFTDDGGGAGTLSGTPSAAGDFAVVLRVSDGTATTEQAFSVVVSDRPNTPPAFTSTAATSGQVGTAYSYAVTATDGDGDPLTLTAPTLPGWLSFTDDGGGAGTLSGTPSAAGAFDVVLRASDGTAAVEQRFTVTVAEAPPPTDVAVDLVFSLSDGAADLELRAGLDPTATTGLDPLLGEGELPPFPPSGVFEARFVGASVPAELGQGSYRDYRSGGADFEGSVEHQLQWQLGSGPALEIGYDLPDDVSARVRDPFGGSVLDETLTGSGTFTVSPASLTQALVTVTYGPPNEPPAITSTAVTSGQVGAAYSYAVTATDTDGDPLTLTAPTLPTWATFTDGGGGSGTLSGTPATAGDFDVVLRASDGAAAVEQRFTVTVAEAPNTPPSFASTPVTTAEVGVGYSYAVTATDGDGDALTLSAPTVPGWLSFTDNGGGTGTLSGTPPAAGSYPVVLRVSDGTDADEQSFTVTVSAGLSAAFAGTQAGRPTFNRPTCSPEVPSNPGLACSASGQTVTYETHHLTVSASGQYIFTADWSGFDGYLALYRDDFEEGLPTRNILGVDDDFNGIGYSQLIIDLTAGRYVLVATLWSEAGTPGGYSGTVTGPGTIGIVTQRGAVWDASTTEGLFRRPACSADELTNAVSQCTLASGDISFTSRSVVTDAAGLHQVRSRQSNGDGVILVYEGSFDPENPLDGLIAYNDDDFDLRSSEVTFQARTPGFSIDNATRVGYYTIVNTTFSGTTPVSSETEIRPVSLSNGIAGSALDFEYQDSQEGAIDGSSLSMGDVRCSAAYPTNARSQCTANGSGRFEGITFTLPGDKTATFHSAQQFDGTLLIYDGPFNPSDPLDNLVAYSDDGTGGIGTTELHVPGRAGATFTLVTQQFGEGTGRFINRVFTETGPGFRFSRAVATDDALDAVRVELAPPAPNPTALDTRLNLTLAEAGPARLVVLDALGREVLTVHDGPLSAGAHEFVVDTGHLASGAYVIRAVTDGTLLSRPFTVVR